MDWDGIGTCKITVSNHSIREVDLGCTFRSYTKLMLLYSQYWGSNWAAVKKGYGVCVWTP